MRRFMLAAAALAALMVAPEVGAQEMRDMQVARQAFMRSNAALLGVINGFNEGTVTDVALVQRSAGAINRIAKALPGVFPPGSGAAAGQTRALDAIWADWDGFGAAAQGLDDASAAVVAAAEGGNAEAIAEAAGGLGGACGACHGTYRGPAN